MFVVTGATGHTGSATAEALLARGKKVRVVVRDAARAAGWKARGAEVIVASLDDAAALTEALRGAEGAFLMVPPEYGSNDYLGSRRPIVDAFARALEAARPKRTVFLSSIGAQRDAGTGPILSLHYGEERLAKSPARVTFLRAAYFFENWGSVLPVARAQGVLPSTLALGPRIPMVSTRDIGRVAAEILTGEREAGPVVELVGPAEYAPEDVAQALSKVLAKPVTPVPVAESAIVPTLTSAGFSPNVAELFREMVSGFNSGATTAEQAPSAWVRGTVGVEEALRGLAATSAA
jgi:uncharacterized protein YbjT (DUF2867 family)